MRITPVPDRARALFSDEALAFVAALHGRFETTRRHLLARRAERQRAFDAGALPQFLPETAQVRGGRWQVAPAPADLQRRWVEITGPVERKMMINALNSGADCFMADFEDALSPTWSNITDGQRNLYDAVRRTLWLDTPEGKHYRLNERTATLLVRPRGWHLDEKHVEIDGTRVSASLFDFGLSFFHNAKELLARNSGPYFYLPKMESHLEARLWAEVFAFAEATLGIGAGTIRATVLIETLPAAFEMEEILYELLPYASGLNAGRWDYLFSFIKKLHLRNDLMLPDRAQLTMTVPFMRAYTQQLVQSCHAHGAHAMGGMAPFIPSRKDPSANEAALARVREDKLREVGDGFDGTWVAHPDLVPVARQVFADALGTQAHQKYRQRAGRFFAGGPSTIVDDVTVTAAALVDTRLPGSVTEAGVRNNISVALQYLRAWLDGNGAVAIFNLMEDAATAEIARAQLWQWIHHGAKLADGRTISAELYQALKEDELRRLSVDDRQWGPSEQAAGVRRQETVALLDELVLQPSFAEFLTTFGYRHLE
jgi:malate synthase